MAVLDTNVIIEIARGNRRVLDSVLSADRYFYITSITRFEILVGAPKLAELDLMNALECLNFDSTSADLSAEIYRELRRRGREMSLRDLFIGAICIRNNQKLVTADSDFEILKDFGLELHLV